MSIQLDSSLKKDKEAPSQEKQEGSGFSLQSLKEFEAGLWIISIDSIFTYGV